MRIAARPILHRGTVRNTPQYSSTMSRREPTMAEKDHEHDQVPDLIGIDAEASRQPQAEKERGKNADGGEDSVGGNCDGAELEEKRMHRGLASAPRRRKVEDRPTGP